MIRNIPIDQLETAENIRDEYVEIEELALSIASQGLINPITIRQKDDKWVIVCGHRRYRACYLLHTQDGSKFREIPCSVIDTLTDDNVIFYQLHENIHQDTLKPLELKKALTALKDKGMSHKDIAGQLSKSEGYIKNLFSVLFMIDRSPELVELLASNVNITISDLAEVKSLPPDIQVALLKEKACGKIKSQQELRARVVEYHAGKEALSTTPKRRKSSSIFVLKNDVLKARGFTYNPERSTPARDRDLMSALSKIMEFVEAHRQK